MSIDYNKMFKAIERNKGKKALDASITIRLDGLKKKKFEKVCDSIGMTISSAVNAFVDKAINLKALPFSINGHVRKRKLFPADNRYNISDDILLNDDISELFEGANGDELLA